MTRFADFLRFGQLLKAFGHNLLAQISHILRHFCECVKLYHFLVKSFLGHFYRHLAIFSGHTAWRSSLKTLS